MAHTGGWSWKARAARAKRLHHREGLDGDEELALVGPVGDEAGEGAEDEHRAELGGGQHAEGDAAVGELEDEQRLGDQREPVADLRDPLAR